MEESDYSVKNEIRPNRKRSLLKKNSHDIKIERRAPNQKILILEKIAILIIKKKKIKKRTMQERAK